MVQRIGSGQHFPERVVCVVPGWGGAVGQWNGSTGDIAAGIIGVVGGISVCVGALRLVPVCIEDEAATGSCSAGIAGRAGDAHYDLNRSRIPIRESAAVAKRFSETMGNRKLSAFPDYVNMELAFSCGKFGITEV